MDQSGTGELTVVRRWVLPEGPATAGEITLTEEVIQMEIIMVPIRRGKNWSGPEEINDSVSASASAPAPTRVIGPENGHPLRSNGTWPYS